MAQSRTIQVALLLCVGNALAWKQLSAPTSFSISQQHPAAGGSSGHNAISDGGDAHSSASISFGNTFLDTHATGHESTLLGSGSHDEQPEPRIVHHQDPVYDSSYFNHLGSSSVSFLITIILIY